MRTVAFGTQEHTRVLVCDKRGQGNANHEYKIQLTDGKTLEQVNFQNGPVKEFGRNGIHNEDLLVIVADRLVGFQAGEYACAANQKALESVLDALKHLRIRTETRKARGVEGTNKK